MRRKVLVGILSLTLIGGGEYLFTHHRVTDKNTCHEVDVGLACSWHFEGNK